MSPQVGYGWSSEPSNHYYGFKYNLRHITKAGETVIVWFFKRKLGPKCDENTPKLADAPTFGHTASPQVWSGWVSKPSSHPHYFKYDLKYITEYPTGK